MYAPSSSHPPLAAGPSSSALGGEDEEHGGRNILSVVRELDVARRALGGERQVEERLRESILAMDAALGAARPTRPKRRQQRWRQSSPVNRDLFSPVLVWLSLLKWKER